MKNIHALIDTIIDGALLVEDAATLLTVPCGCLLEGDQDLLDMIKLNNTMEPTPAEEIKIKQADPSDLFTSSYTKSEKWKKIIIKRLHREGLKLPWR